MLELLVIVSESGLGPHAALQRVAREIRPTAPVLSAELAESVVEMGMTSNRTQALSHLAARVPLTEVQVFAQTLSQTERYGTPFATAMRALIRAQRADRMLRIEEMANRMPALMTIPLIVFIMPALFVVLVGPAALGIIDTLLVDG
jgi:tight adherence protein C